MDQNNERLDVDFLFVGAGPSNLSAAIHLSDLIQNHNAKNPNHLIDMPMMAVIEKGTEVGSHQMSGAVLDPSALKILFPDYLNQSCPIEADVSDEAFHFLMPKTSIPFPVIPPPMKNHGNHVISLSRFTQWLGQKAIEKGVNIFTSFTGSKIIYDQDKVLGVGTLDKGIDAHGNKKPNFEAGVDIYAKCTVFGEGVRGYLAKSLIPKLGLQNINPQTFETAVKEVWQCKPGSIKPGMVIHTMGYPLDRNTVGGSFIYGMQNDLLVVGLVLSLNYENPWLEPYVELQKLKAHPLVSKYLDQGKQVAYGAKAICSGGYYSMPRLYFDGGLIVGESGSLLDMSKLKGIHIGMHSGIEAAKIIFKNILNKKEFSKENLSEYQETFLKSKSAIDLYKARNFHQALSKGLPWSLFHIGLQQISHGRGLIDPMPAKLDRQHYRRISQQDLNNDRDLKNHPTYVDKLTSVFNSGTIHEEDQIPHLKIKNESVCKDHCIETYASPCNRFCPAQVYEMIDQKLKINFSNCVHCQTCDIKCPMDNIMWTPPESGGGPRYSLV